MIVACSFLACFALFGWPTERGGDRWLRPFLFHPSPYSPNDPYAAPPQAKEVWLRAEDGPLLHAWYYPIQRPKAAVLYLRGNAGNLGDWGPVAQWLGDRQNVSVLVFDYRGFGRSEGQPSAPGILLDARAARDWLCLETGLPPEELVYHGYSLGAALAADLAAETGARLLVMESGFASLPDMAWSILPLLPYRWLIRHPLDSRAKLTGYHGPLLIYHGAEDKVIPAANAQKLFDASPSAQKTLIVQPGLDHNNMPPPEFDDAYAAWLANRKG